MDSEIVQLLESQMSLTEEERQAAAELIYIREFEKGTILLKEGQVATESYFNLKGLVRLYYLVDGEERTTTFFAEGEPICSLQSYNQQIPANHYMECVEDCKLAVFTYENEKKLYERAPRFEALCRIDIEKEFGKHQERLSSYIMHSPEQRYLKLVEEPPDLLQRVPQYHLASYLGVKPESLSRIRKRVALRD